MEPCPCDYFLIETFNNLGPKLREICKILEKLKICVTFVMVGRLYRWKLIETHLLLLAVYG